MSVGFGWRGWAGAALLAVALLAGYVVWETHDQREARRELMVLYASLTVDTSAADLRRMVGVSRHLFLNNDARPTVVMTPLAWDGGNWNIRLEYSGEQLCRARIGIYDDGSRPGDGPPDRVFPCRRER